MPRSKNEQIDNYFTAFPVRLRKKMEETKTSQQKLADCLGIKRQTVSSYTDGSSSPGWKALAEIARYFHVSADWLLGLLPEDCETPDLSLQEICVYTGLSENAVAALHSEKQDPDCTSSVASRLIEAEDLHRLLWYVAEMQRENAAAYHGSTGNIIKPENHSSAERADYCYFQAVKLFMQTLDGLKEREKIAALAHEAEQTD